MSTPGQEYPRPYRITVGLSSVRDSYFRLFCSKREIYQFWAPLTHGVLPLKPHFLLISARLSTFCTFLNFPHFLLRMFTTLGDLPGFLEYPTLRITVFPAQNGEYSPPFGSQGGSLPGRIPPILPKTAGSMRIVVTETTLINRDHSAPRYAHFSQINREREAHSSPRYCSQNRKIEDHAAPHSPCFSQRIEERGPLCAEVSPRLWEKEDHSAQRFLPKMWEKEDPSAQRCTQGVTGVTYPAWYPGGVYRCYIPSMVPGWCIRGVHTQHGTRVVYTGCT